MKEENNIVKSPYFNEYCNKCKNHYLLDGDESRCKNIRLGMSHAMCCQVLECKGFDKKGGRKYDNV